MLKRLARSVAGACRLNAALDGQGDGEKRDASGPLFVTRRGVPVGSNWISNKFSKAVIDAGMQKRTSHRVYRIHSHEVRDLLKSTLLVSGCA